jgi:hypothetical protein
MAAVIRCARGDVDGAQYVLCDEEGAHEAV